MATYIITLILVIMALFQLTTSTNIPPKDQDLSVAIQEMQKANYFTFVMLINMSPRDRKLLGNVTFLMPNDRMLSKATIPQNAVSSFLLRHSVPSPLLFEHLQYVPTGSVLPSSMPEYMLSISNGGGRRSFFLNNVRIISPNICTAGSSIRCHGIDGVLTSVKSPGSNTSLPTCSNNPHPGSVASASPVASPPSAVSMLPFPDGFPVPAPQPSDSSQHSSGSSQFLSDRKLSKFMGTLLVVSMIGVSI
ncbi:FAS1 domain-containing protein SELMODRAFT_448915-like [Durio zibethinus]|uniref:FAS1 domain-containing protein SELMODRAFT_448915-like n=1 Tax=Durio zibethinus TaxID=66656 RepID=A0A6P5WVT7_DURZI|nr:FAS1 domain-containing protein SELMODRAFT_448915-like [Durio zibethinus]